MDIVCKRCGRQVPAQDVNIERLVAKCTGCNAVWGFSQDLGTPAGRMAPRPKVPMPPRVTVNADDGRMEISWSWFTPSLLFLVFFCVAWDSFLVFWYTTATAGRAPWIFKVFPLAHVAVGIGLTYSTLAGFINRTTIRVEGALLSVRHGPLPWLGNLETPCRSLKQVYCTQDIHRGKHGSTGVTYSVHAVNNGGKKVTLCKRLHDADQALYVEQRLEQHLGIMDQPVAGEVAR